MKIERCRVATFREEGKKVDEIAMTCWEKATKWARKMGLKSEDCQWVEEWHLKNWQRPAQKIQVYYPATITK